MSPQLHYDNLLEMLLKDKLYIEVLKTSKWST